MANQTVETDPEPATPQKTFTGGAAATKAAAKPIVAKDTTKKAAAKRVLGKKVARKKVSPTKKARTKSSSRKTLTDGKQKSKRTFPHRSLEEALRIPNALRQFNSGNAWAPSEVAGALGVGLSGNYFYLTAASRDYGFTLGTRDSERIELTPVGRTLVYPKSPQEARDALIAGFRNVELFKKVYDYYQGENLPDIQYLKNTLKRSLVLTRNTRTSFMRYTKRILLILERRGPNRRSQRKGAM